MKKHLLPFLILFAVLFPPINKASAQRSVFSFGVTPHYKVNGYGVSANFNYHHNPTDYFQLLLIAAFSEEQPNSTVKFPFEDYLANFGYFTTVLTSRRKGISIFFGGGPSAGYEIYNDGIIDTSFGIQTPESTFVYGAFASFEIDIFLTEAFSMVIPTTGIYHFNSEAEKMKLLLGVGIRCYLN